MKAFPYVREIESEKEGYKAYVHEEGMDLRDYFAAMAMPIFIAEKDEDGMPLFESHSVADLAYEQADAMMEERKKIK